MNRFVTNISLKTVRSTMARMKYYSILSGMMILIICWSAQARPDDKKDNVRVGSLISSKRLRGSTKTSGTNRQFTPDSSVSTASSSLNGNALGSPLQSIAVMQQLQATGHSNPAGTRAELAAQNQEAVVSQTQQQQKAVLAAVQAQKQHIAAAQAALTGQGSNHLPGQVQSNLPAMKAHEQLAAQHQRLSIQQQLLKQQQNPNAQLATQENLLLVQLLNNEPSNRPLLLEQIRKQLSRQQAYEIAQHIHQQPLELQQLQQQQLMQMGLNGGGSMSVMNADVQRQLLLHQLQRQHLQRQHLQQQLLQQLQQPLQQQQLPQIGLNSISVMNAEIQQKLLLERLQKQQLQQQLNGLRPYLGVL